MLNTIKNKLILTILAVTIVTTVIGFSIVIYSHIHSYKRIINDNLNMQASLIGQYCITPLTFNDEKGAKDVLNKLKSIPSIVSGELYDEHSKSFAKYEKQESDEPGGYIHISKVIEYNNVKYGTIYLVASTAEYSKNVNRYVLTMIGVMISLIILSILLANWLQKYISVPILDLAGFTEKVSETADYTLRIKKETNDEIGILYEGFNKMLEQINTRERERDEAENALRASENKNRSLIEAIPDLIFILDQAGNYKYIKAKDENMLSLPAEKLIGRNIREAGFTPEQVKMIMNNINKAINICKTQTFEYELMVKKGWGYFEARLVAINDNEILGIVRDITEQKETKQQLEQEKIKAAAAEEADKLKSAFLANMSHEIRTPMNAIIGFSNLLRDDDISIQEKVDYIDIINKSGNNLIRLIDDIIDISKIEAGQMTIRRTECDINKILTEVYQFFDKNKKAENKNDITLCLNIPRTSNHVSTNSTELTNKSKQPVNENIFIVSTDPYRLKQILTNLLSNSLKFTDKGMIEFGYSLIENNLSTENISSQISYNEPYLKFYVKDTGIGIPETQSEEIFKRFKKIEDKRTRLYGGAGLGLAICKSLVENLGGEIWLESVYGKGSVFYFTLPLS